MNRIRPGAIDRLVGQNLKKPWRARWRERDAHGGSVQRSLCFEERDEAVLHLQRVDAVVRRAQPSILDGPIGRPGRLIDLIPVYTQFMIDRQTGMDSVRNTKASLGWMLRKDKIATPIEYIHEITYGLLFEFVQRNWHDNADRGKQRLHQIKTFLRRMQKRRIKIDPEALTLNAKEFGPPKPVLRKGVWTDADIKAIMAELTRPRETEQLVFGKRTINGVRLNERIYYENRLAFAPIFLLLLRYPLRPITACRLDVRDWIPDERVLILRAEAVKNRHPQALPIDALTAAVLDKCARGKEPTSPLFSAPQSSDLEIRRWNRDFMSKLMLDLLKRAGVSGSLYRAKHTACSYLLRAHQSDLKLVSAYTGHQDLRQLMGYNLVPADRERRISRGYDQLDRESEGAQSGMVIGRFLESGDASVPPAIQADPAVSGPDAQADGEQNGGDEPLSGVA